MDDPKNILLVQLYSNGDCLYATTVARQIKKDFPDSILTWAIADFCQNIIDNNPYADNKLVLHIKKDDVPAFRKLKKRFLQEKAHGKWDEVFITMNADENLALYDGTIRGMIFRAYPFPITVPVEPVVVLTAEEMTRVDRFAASNNLSSYKHVILWEYAAQSGQSALTFDVVIHIAEEITKLPSTCVILSSASKFDGRNKIIDASVLSVRENAALTHYCTLLLGCSSGITWLNTSSAGNFIPMLQLLNPNTAFINAPSVDFRRYGIPDDKLIELFHFDQDAVYSCIKEILQNNFESAKQKFHQPFHIQFATTGKIVYNMLCYLRFGAVARHYRVITSIYGNHPAFRKQFFKSIGSFPFKLVWHFFRKRIVRIK